MERQVARDRVRLRNLASSTEGNRNGEKQNRYFKNFFLHRRSVSLSPPTPSTLPGTRLERHVRQRGAGKRRLWPPHHRCCRPLRGKPRWGYRLRLVVLSTRRGGRRRRRRQRRRRQRDRGLALLLEKLFPHGAYLASQRFEALQQARVSSRPRRRRCRRRRPVHRHRGRCCDGSRWRRGRRRRCCCRCGRRRWRPLRRRCRVRARRRRRKAVHSRASPRHPQTVGPPLLHLHSAAHLLELLLVQVALVRCVLQHADRGVVVPLLLRQRRRRRLRARGHVPQLGTSVGREHPAPVRLRRRRRRRCRHRCLEDGGHNRT
eukprot:Rhum_TRINITY_DN8272_c0_g1::Rhum_TRINITY_DN8272_c0_g1_i1::g.27002::m.27002